MNSSLNSVNALATFLLLLGIVLFNNSVATWQSSQRLYSSLNFQKLETNYQNSPEAIQKEYRQTLMRQALYIAFSVFLLLLGVQMLLKRRWACHFFCSIRQLSQLSLLLIPLGTMLLLLNRSLIDSLVEIYQPIIQELMQQQNAAQDPNGQVMIMNDQVMRVAIQAAFWIIALLGMAITNLVLRLSSRCLRREVQDILFERSPQPSRMSYFILCLPMELLLVLLLSVYGTAKQLLEIMLAFLLGPASGILLWNLAAFASFALALLQLTNRNMQQKELKFQLLKKALGFCSLAHFMQLLQNIFSLQGDVAETAAKQMNSLSNAVLLFMLGVLYNFLLRSERHQGLDHSDDD